jgi:hypothetical protein
VTAYKPTIKNVFDTITVLAIVGGTILWQAFSPGTTLINIINITRRAFDDLFSFNGIVAAGSVNAVYAVPTVFTTASWINLGVSLVVIFLLMTGISIIVAFSGRLFISESYKMVAIFGAILFAISYLLPSVAATINFTRLYGISIIFLFPCFAIGGLTVIKAIKKLSKKNKNFNLLQLNFDRRFDKVALLFIVMFLSAYFLSQTGLVNYATNGGIKGTVLDYYRMSSSDPQFQTQFYATYSQMPDVYSAVWLNNNINVSTATIYSDTVAQINTLISEGLIPANNIIPFTNNTSIVPGAFIYLNSLNLIKGVVPTPEGYLNATNIYFYSIDCNIIYSNGNSEIFSSVR